MRIPLEPISRRRFGELTGSLVAPLVVLGGCDLHGVPMGPDDGRLLSRPKTGIKTTAEGTRALGLGSGRDAILQMPAKRPAGPVPLLIMLHGAGSSGERVLARVSAASDAAGVAVLAPDSRGQTWDGIRGSLGPDLAFLNQALDRVFDTVAVDPARLTMGGFSDGATYAVSIGLINGDLFPRVAAFSPGFVIERPAHGRPRFFISHGTGDQTLPIDRCGRVIVQGLRAQHYDVTFREFDGGHEVPEAVATEAMAWITR